MQRQTGAHIRGITKQWLKHATKIANGGATPARKFGFASCSIRFDWDGQCTAAGSAL
jgi:hypothetical protein